MCMKLSMQGILVIDKMENDLMPDLRKNIVEDFYLTPDYFEKDLISTLL